MTLPLEYKNLTAGQVELRCHWRFDRTAPSSQKSSIEDLFESTAIYKRLEEVRCAYQPRNNRSLAFRTMSW
jgi:hypothetical protein